MCYNINVNKRETNDKETMKMKNTKIRNDLKSGTYVYVADYGFIVIASEYDPYHKWYHYHDTEIDENGKLTGRYLGEIVDGHRKAELLKLIAQVEKVNLAQTIAVGDGANDLPMLGEAGLGIAFHAKPRVVANAKQSLNTIGIDGVLYFLGFKDSYLGEQGRF